MILDKYTHQPRGFAFVTMATDEAAQAAIQALDGADLQGQALKVNVARPREAGGGGGFRGGGGRGREPRGGYGRSY